MPILYHSNPIPDYTVGALTHSANKPMRSETKTASVQKALGSEITGTMATVALSAILKLVFYSTIIQTRLRIVIELNPHHII